MRQTKSSLVSLLFLIVGAVALLLAGCDKPAPPQAVRQPRSEVRLHHRHEPMQSGRAVARADERANQGRR